ESIFSCVVKSRELIRQWLEARGASKCTCWRRVLQEATLAAGVSSTVEPALQDPTSLATPVPAPAASPPTPRRRPALVLILLACAYVVLFIPANFTGAQDPEMLAAFVLDEYAQFPIVLQMTNRERSWSATLHNLVFYNYYNYGYPFFLTS